MIVDVPESVRPHLVVACRSLAREMQRNGLAPSDDLLTLMETLRNGSDAQPSKAALRMRRYRARKAAERRQLVA
jgi:hypothetical protein